MSNVVQCVALARQLFSKGNPAMGIYPAIYERNDEDGNTWLVVEIFSTWNMSGGAPVHDRVDRREVKALYRSGPQVTVADRHYELRDVLAVRLFDDMFALLREEIERPERERLERERAEEERTRPEREAAERAEKDRLAEVVRKHNMAPKDFEKEGSK